MEHELENSWTLYVTKQRTVQGFEKNKKEWEDRLETIHTFKTAEAFWCVHNNLRAPSQMKNDRGDYYMFRDSILPEWEHPNNTGGGSLLLIFDPLKVDEIWIKSLLSLIGHTYQDLMVHICGVELAIRKNRYKIAIWVENTSDSTVRKLAEMVKSVIDNISIEYRKHETNEKVEFTIQ